LCARISRNGASTGRLLDEIIAKIPGIDIHALANALLQYRGLKAIGLFLGMLQTVHHSEYRVVEK
jgi:hypothetical protein